MHQIKRAVQRRNESVSCSRKETIFSSSRSGSMSFFCSHAGFFMDFLMWECDFKHFVVMFDKMDFKTLFQEFGKFIVVAQIFFWENQTLIFDLRAAISFSFKPPIGRTRPVKVSSPVMPRFSRTGLFKQERKERGRPS